jgi:4-amino-4-deoxy-L-arabinose transferase-like glycosyltransferase
MSMPTLTKGERVQNATQVVTGILPRLEEWIEKGAIAAVPALLLSFACWAWLASRGIRFWFDELLELSAARASTPRELMSFLAAGVDFNPPLSHFLVRFSTALFGDAEWAARLPAFLGMILLLVCMYLFVSRWLNRAQGILAMLIVMCLPLREYAIQARPYGLVLGFAGLSLVFYQRAVKSEGRRLSLVGLGLCTACLAATHYYAVLLTASLIPVDVIRTWKARRPDWRLLCSLAVPPVIVLALLRDLIHGQRLQLTHYFSRGNILSFDHGYDILDLDPLVYCVALLLITLVMGVRFKANGFPGVVRFPANPGAQEALLGAGLLVLPIVGAVCTQLVTHAYVTRYFLAAGIGLCVCVCFGVRLLSGILPGIVVLLILPLGLGFGKALLQAAHRPEGALPPQAALITATDPVLFDTPGTYLQVYHYFPQLRPKLWAIADTQASLRYRHYDTDDKIMIALANKVAGDVQVISLRTAAHRWSHFSLVPRSGDSVWALRCVIESGADVGVHHTFDASNFIFDVRVSRASVPLIDACGSPADLSNGPSQ